MKTSFTYQLTLFVIKLKGVKKQFSTVPINYLSIRKGDVHHPKGRFFNSPNVSRFSMLKSEITQIKSQSASNKLVIYVHGGAFISGPSQFHWDSVQEIYQQTNHSIWMCDYPKAPEFTMIEVLQNVTAIYEKALSEYAAENISLVGDSAGGTIVLNLMNQFKNKGFQYPEKIILISPVVDLSFENPAIDAIESKDVMLGRNGVISAKKMSVKDGDLKDPQFSPLFADVKFLPMSYFFLAENDICFPDQLLYTEKLTKENIPHQVVIGEKMPHIWPLLPVMKEAKIALNQISTILK